MIITTKENPQQQQQPQSRFDQPLTGTRDLLTTMESGTVDECEKLNCTEDAKLPPTPLPTRPMPPPYSEKDQAITSPGMRYTIFALTMLENLIFSGIVFGWPALFYILKGEHIFESLCQPILQNGSSAFGLIHHKLEAISSSNVSSPAGNGNRQMVNIYKDCSRQENLLNNAYTIGIFAMGFTSFVWGFMLDSKGLRFVRLALNLLISLGCLLLTLTTEEHSYLIIPAIVILGLIGVPLRIANMQIADYFPRKRSTVIAIFSGAFSASPVVFVICKYAYDNLNLSYSAVMSSLFVLSLMMLPITVYLLPQHSVRNREAKLWGRWEQYRTMLGLDKLEDENQVPKSKLNAKPKMINKQKLIALLEQKQNNPKKGSVLDLLTSGSTSKTPSSGFYEEEEIQCLNEMSSGSNSSGSLGKSPAPVIVPIGVSSQSQKKPGSGFLRIFKGASAQDDIPLKVSLLSFSFLSHQLWFSWLNTYMVLYSGSLVLWLSRVTSDLESTRLFTQAFGLIQVSALVFAPFAGYVMDRSVAAAFGEPDLNKRRLCQAQSGYIPILITTLTLSCAVTCRFFNSSAAVYTSLVFITLLRSFLIAVASAYIRVRFPASHFSRLNGIMCTTGAFFSLLQSPLFYFEQQSPQMAFYVNVFCAIMTALSWANPISLGITAVQRTLLSQEDRYTEILRQQEEKKYQAKLQQQISANKP